MYPVILNAVLQRELIGIKSVADSARLGGGFPEYSASRRRATGDWEATSGGATMGR